MSQVLCTCILSFSTLELIQFQHQLQVLNQKLQMFSLLIPLWSLQSKDDLSARMHIYLWTECINQEQQ